MSLPSTPPQVQTNYEDPSHLTTAAIHREFSVISHDLENMKVTLTNDLATRAETRQRELNFQDKLFATKLEGVQKEFDSKINSINEATRLRLAAIHDIPKDINSAIDHHEDLQLERFKSIAQQFSERDIRTQQAQEASAQALAAALQAAKELVGAQGEASAAAAVKSETSFTKQIDQIGTIIQTLEKALDARITELKERIDRGEGNSSGTKDALDTMTARQQFEQTQQAVNQAFNQQQNQNQQQNKQSISANQIAVFSIILLALTVIIPIFETVFFKKG